MSGWQSSYTIKRTERWVRSVARISRSILYLLHVSENEDSKFSELCDKSFDMTVLEDSKLIRHVTINTIDRKRKKRKLLSPLRYLTKFKPLWNFIWKYDQRTIAAFSKKSCFATVIKFVSLIDTCWYRSVLVAVTWDSSRKYFSYYNNYTRGFSLKVC